MILKDFIITLVDSIIPLLPLSFFIGVNTVNHGFLIGVLISLIGTIIGCSVSYTFFRILLGNSIESYINNKKGSKSIFIKSFKKTMVGIENIDFSNLTLLMALPFTPAFLINIACGCTKVNFKKFFFSLLIGKTVMVFFWSFIGKSLMESITDPLIIMIICVLLLLVFVVCKIVVKKFDIK